MLEMARSAYRANSFQDRVVFLREYSVKATLPEQVDVIVADQLGPVGIEAGVLECFQDARERFLKPGGVFVPRRLELHAALLETPEMWQRLEFWEHERAGFDFRPIRAQADNMIQWGKFLSEQLLSDGQQFAAFDFATHSAASFVGECVLHVTRPGMLHGLATWFHAQLSDSAAYTNSPVAATRIDRPAAFFPLARAVEVQAGEEFRVTMRMNPAEKIFTWQLVKVGNAAPPVAFTHSTLHNLLISPDELRRTRPDAIPQLSPRGAARLATLTLCDGQNRLHDIEQAIYEQHRQLFRTPDAAAQFVAEVMRRDVQ